MESACKPQISVRYATLQDVPAIANIYTSSMCEDEVFDYICCYRDKYWDEHVFYYNQRMKMNILDSRIAVMVAELHSHPSDPCERHAKQIVSFAIWSFKGVAMQGEKSWRSLLFEIMLRECENYQS
jgi:hypothetical protein